MINANVAKLVNKCIATGIKITQYTETLRELKSADMRLPVYASAYVQHHQQRLNFVKMYLEEYRELLLVQYSELVDAMEVGVKYDCVRENVYAKGNDFSPSDKFVAYLLLGERSESTIVFSHGYVVSKDGYTKTI